MTGVIRNQYNNGRRHFIASEKYFGDQWDCAYKTLRITYRQCGNLVSEIAVDNKIAPMDSYYNLAQEGETEKELTCENKVEYHGTCPKDGEAEALAQFTDSDHECPYHGYGGYGGYGRADHSKHGWKPHGYKGYGGHYYPYDYKVYKKVACYYKQVPKLPPNSKSFIVLPDRNCFCCSCPEERAVKQHGEPDVYLDKAAKHYVSQKKHINKAYGTT
jgi:hypothetical protein